MDDHSRPGHDKHFGELGHRHTAILPDGRLHDLRMQADAAAIFARLVTDPTIAEAAPWPRSR